MNVTIDLDKKVVASIRQEFDGNLSKGINTLLARQLKAMKTKTSGFGLLKGHGPALLEELRKLRHDDHLD